MCANKKGHRKMSFLTCGTGLPPGLHVFVVNKCVYAGRAKLLGAELLQHRLLSGPCAADAVGDEKPLSVYAVKLSCNYRQRRTLNGEGVQLSRSDRLKVKRGKKPRRRPVAR